ncbi:Uncharacterised protein [Escherichia coli]|uniref:hypothetical protein n=1 Tax=Escherichia coli TaxID=562 RepID=UPI000D6E5C8C|nr:hypothetical protein [Escherichia coli]EKX8507223.1 hypothetical protein [Citrobacter sedlakii]EEW0977976.1 hypothetical protein [Escherichia coli]EFH3906107.1 hypothetical protein [Escherichia coli]EFL9604723.1 hypothetical protein [Escherichia coli]EHC4416677.1 hypothetical protein [Escherichia coli]
MNVLSQLINDALNHQGGHIRTDGNGDITQFIPVEPAAVRYLSMNDVLTPKGGKQTTFNAVLAERSLVAQAGAKVIRIPGPMTTQPTGKTGANIGREVADRFVVIRPGKFAKVTDGEEISMSGKPYMVAAFDHNTAPAYGVGWTLTRQQLKHEFADDTVLEAVNTAIERGIADLADFVLLNHLETAAETLASPSFTAVAQKIAAKNLRFDEVKAIVGGDCTGLELQDGVLRAYGVRAEISGQTSSTIIGAFGNAAVALDDEIRVTARRVLNGAVEVVVWVNASALVPDSTMFWKA